MGTQEQADAMQWMDEGLRNNLDEAITLLRIGRWTKAVEKNRTKGQAERSSLVANLVEEQVKRVRTRPCLSKRVRREA